MRRSTLAETADLLVDCVVEGRQSLAFIRSRRGAEATALMARDLLIDVDPALADGVAAYRGGYLPEERRELEARLRDGRLRALATTNALEMGIDVSGLDVVITAGWPGTRASMWQQFGRAGRAGCEALGIFVARDDPLDSYIVHHPRMVLDRDVEASVFDPGNRYVLAPHLCAAAAEVPLSEDGLLEWFGPTARSVVDDLVEQGMLRRRPGGWFWTRRERATDLTDLRGSGGAPVRVVEDGTGRLLGTVDRAAAPGVVHRGAVYVHQGVTHVVTALDLEDAVATVVEQDVDYSTLSRSISDIRIVDTIESHPSGVLHRGTVDVTSQVVSFQRRRPNGENLGEELLDMPVQELRTHSVWWTLPESVVLDAGIDASDIPGAAHAAEHASIGLLPLFATCDRWDLGGVSTASHPDTGQPTVFVYDGYPGGAGFTEHGFRIAADWLASTREAIALLRLRERLPVVRPVAQVRQREQPPRQGPGRGPARRGPRRYGGPARADTLTSGTLRPRSPSRRLTTGGAAALTSTTTSMPSLAHDAVAIPFAATIRTTAAQGSTRAWAPATAAMSATVAARWRVTASDPTAPTMSPSSRSNVHQGQGPHHGRAPLATGSRPLPRDRDALGQGHADAAEDRHRRGHRLVGDDHDGRALVHHLEGRPRRGILCRRHGCGDRDPPCHVARDLPRGIPERHGRRGQ